ncbi:nitroreductase family deazaflavin-dependent oxidoreductase [Hamadaea sp. NPDC050747]|uniref:nitroreductase family deazaflavin-dependent oxidoreductase n=1 Tax=Hamadaea sp. NPDC050747 TaxID=3155789 RepID=UPI0033CE7219
MKARDIMGFTEPNLRLSEGRGAFGLPAMLTRLRAAGLSGRGFVVLDHVCRETGRVRRSTVEIVARSVDVVIVAAGFGVASDWFQDLECHPDTTVRIGRRAMAVRAERVDAEARSQAMTTYARQHPAAARRLTRLMGFAVDGTDVDYRAVGAALHMLRLQSPPPA